MPRRTNLFQQVVAIIHGHLAGPASVEESALLPHAVTDDEREVDVVIRTTVASQDVTISIEATSARRPADVQWVETMLQKHSGLPTNKLVLISENGFTAQAKRLANHSGAATLAPEDLDVPDPTGAVVGRLRSLWPKVVSLTPHHVRVHVMRPSGDVVWFRGEHDHLVFLETGREIGALKDTIIGHINAEWEAILRDLDLAGIDRSVTREFEMTISPWEAIVEGVPVPFCVRWDDAPTPELHRVVRVEVWGDARIDVVEQGLTRVRLGEIEYAYGEGAVNDVPALFVMTSTAVNPTLTMRLDTGGGRPSDIHIPLQRVDVNEGE